MWTFEQEQSFALTNVATVVRMTVIKLRSGGLWVYAPIAPTRCGWMYSELPVICYCSDMPIIQYQS